MRTEPDGNEEAHGRRRKEGGDGRVVVEKTTVSRAWIAEKLSKKSAANVGMAIRRLKNGEIKRGYSREFNGFIAQANESHRWIHFLFLT